MRFFPSLIVVVLCFLVPVGSVLAQTDYTDDSKVQIFTSHIDPDTIAVYRLSGLQQSQRLNARMENLSGNLDPILILLPGDTDNQELAEEALQQANQAISYGMGPIIGLSEIID